MELTKLRHYIYKSDDNLIYAMLNKFTNYCSHKQHFDHIKMLV